MWEAVRPRGAQAVKMVSCELSKLVTGLQSSELKLQGLHRTAFLLLPSKADHLEHAPYLLAGVMALSDVTLVQWCWGCSRRTYLQVKNKSGVLVSTSQSLHVRVISQTGREIAYQWSGSFQKPHAWSLQIDQTILNIWKFRIIIQSTTGFQRSSLSLEVHKHRILTLHFFPYYL